MFKGLYLWAPLKWEDEGRFTGKLQKEPNPAEGPNDGLKLSMIELDSTQKDDWSWI